MGPKRSRSDGTGTDRNSTPGSTPRASKRERAPVDSQLPPTYCWLNDKNGKQNSFLLPESMRAGGKVEQRENIANASSDLTSGPVGFRQSTHLHAFNAPTRIYRASASHRENFFEKSNSPPVRTSKRHSNRRGHRSAISEFRRALFRRNFRPVYERRRPTARSERRR